MAILRLLVECGVLALIGIYLFFGLVYLFTGIRIKRVGYLSIRWIQWISRSERVTVEIRKIGLRPQRPSITRRTWLGIVVSDATITVRLGPVEDWGPDDEEPTNVGKDDAPQVSIDDRVRRIGRMLGKIIQHRVLNWVDLELSSTTLVVEGAGTFQMGMFFLGMNSNPQMFKRERILSSADTDEEPQKDQPVEVTVTIRDLYFSINDKEFTEIAKTVVLTVDFLLGGEYGVRGVKAALRIAGFSIPYDNLVTFEKRITEMRATRPESPGAYRPRSPVSASRLELGFIDIFEEVQIHVTLLQISVNAPGVRPAGKPALITLGLKDVGLDLIKLEKANVLNKLFNQGDLVEHQVLLTIISVAIDINTDGRQGHGDQIFNLPLTTLAGKTCVVDRYIKSKNQDTDPGSAVANIVITSPSTDLGPNHLQLILALFNNWKNRPQYFTPPQTPDSRPVTPNLPLTGRYFHLPKIGINLSVHEPSFRMLVPSTHWESRMLVWNISNLLFEFHCQHSPLDKIAYQVDSSLKFGVSQIHLWESDGRQFQILRSGSCEIKLFVPSLRTPHVESDVYLESLQIELNRTEVIDCVTKVIAASRFDLEPDRLRRPKKRHHGVNIEALLPVWLQRITLEGREIGMVVAGVDVQLSEETRGVAIQFQTWMFEYNRNWHVGHKHSVRGHIKSTFEARHFHVFAVESQGHWDRDSPIIDTPDIHISVSLHQGQQKDEIHLTVIVPDFLLGFSLFKLYAVFLGVKTLQTMFKKPKGIEEFERHKQSSSFAFVESFHGIPVQKPRILIVDGRSDLLRIRLNLPEEQNLLFEASDLHVSRENYPGSLPYARASFVRLHIQSLVTPEAWDRIVSIRGFKIEHRDEFRYIDTKKLVPAHFVLRTEAIRFRVPHQFTLFSVIESIKNSWKSSKQLLYRFSHDFSEDFILSPQAEDAKRIPRIRIKSKCVILDLEDDPFEARLGFIYRVGGNEQSARMARDVAFDAKVNALKAGYEEKTKTTTEDPIPEEDESHAHDGVEKPFKKKSRRGPFRREKVKPEMDDLPPDFGHERRKSMRYQPHNAVDPSCEADISIESARKKLAEHNSQAWIRRFRSALDTRAKRLESMREQLWGDDEISLLLQSHEKILPLPSRPPLFSIQLNHVDITLDRPSFGYDQLPEFLYKTGGLPMDTEFTILIPFHLKLTMNEVRVLLRDYPLPFIHIPPVHHSQHHAASTRLPAWSVETDMVIAEELGGEDSIFRCDTIVIPPDLGRKGSPAFKISVPRTATAVKFYSSLNVDINSSSPTKIVWGTSYQPALHDAMQVFDTFSKPQDDPSDRIGFWDKMRLIIHSDFKFNWKGGGDVQFTLKGTVIFFGVELGSRNPYMIIGQGAGFMWCWRGNVVWKIATELSLKDLSHVDSDEFILAIPDFTKEPVGADHYIDHENSFHSSRSLSHNQSRNAVFRKIIMKLNGGVRWIAGLVFERRCSPNCGDCEGKNKCRRFNFIPHHQVHLKRAECCRSTNGEVYDSYRGFRSDFMHGSLSIISPRDSSSNHGYNSVHLSPKAFAHFFSWWHLFSGVMSIPLRQGALFQSVEKPRKKFNTHLATLKYQLDLSPLFLAHMYHHKDSSDYTKGTTTITGIKARLDRLFLDVHQRKEAKVIILKELQTKRRAMHMGINKARVDFEATDLRALAGTVQEVSPSELYELSQNQNMQEEREEWGFKTIELVNDDDLDWIDKDDFVEIDVMLAKSEPIGRIWPLAYGSRFTYYRSTDETSMGKSVAGDSISCQFGSEDSHHCLMNLLEDPESVQYHLFQTRYKELMSLLHNLENRNSKEDTTAELEVVRDKIEFLDKLLRYSYVYNSGSWTSVNGRREQEKDSRGGKPSRLKSEASTPQRRIVSDPISGLGEETHFKNRFVVHNLQLRWHNDIRNIIFNYIHQIGRRRGFIYYMSQRAIKFLSDVVHEQKLQQVQNESNGSVNEADINDSQTSLSSAPDDVALLIQQLLDDKKDHFVVLDETQQSSSQYEKPGATKHLASVDFPADVDELDLVKNEYSVQLIAPQIQLQSKKNVDAAVIISAESMYLQIFAVMDKESIDDEVGGLIQRRFSIGMDHAQFFVAHKKSIQEYSHQSIFSNVHDSNSTQWPPWIPVETVYNFNADPLPFTRMVERTSASMRYVKHNPLRLKLNDRVNDGIFRSAEISSLTPHDQRVDDISVHFPRVVVTADSAQYYALYLIVTDLLIYSEPLVKRQNVELDKIMLASDFSDLTGAPEMVKTLQQRIRQLEEIDLHFRVNSHSLDKEGCKDQVLLRDELNSCEEELFFLMKAVTMSQEKHYSETETVPTMRWYLAATEVIWHMVCNDKSPMVDLGLSNATYRRCDNSDLSNYNTLEIEMIQGINLLSNALYTDVLGPYFGSSRTVVDAQRSKMIRVYWHMLESIGGIPIMDHFEVNLFPLMVKIEYDFGRRVFEYMFPEPKVDATRTGMSSRRQRQDADDSESDSDLDSVDHSIAASSQASFASSMSTISTPKRPVSSAGATVKGTSSLRVIGEESQRAETMSITSRQSSTSDQTRRPSVQKSTSEEKEKKEKGTGQTDDLTQMLSRASQNITLVYVKVPSTAQKGKSIEDVQDFVFTMPTIEYRNRTWSYIDLAMHLKKDVIKAILSHSGMLIRDKISFHRKAKPPQNQIMRQLSSYRSYTHLNDLRADDRSSPSGESPSRRSTESLPSLQRTLSIPQNSSGVLSPMSSVHSRHESDEDRSSGIFNNALTRHLRDISHLARHRDGIGDESEESSVRKAKMLLGKFVGK